MEKKEWKKNEKKNLIDWIFFIYIFIKKKKSGLNPVFMKRRGG